MYIQVLGDVVCSTVHSSSSSSSGRGKHAIFSIRHCYIYLLIRAQEPLNGFDGWIHFCGRIAQPNAPTMPMQRAAYQYQVVMLCVALRIFLATHLNYGKCVFAVQCSMLFGGTTPCCVRA